MHTLQHTLDALRALPVSFNAPATSEELTQLETLIGQPIPSDLRALYRDHNGGKREIDDEGFKVGMLFRSLSIEELGATMDEMREAWFPDHPDLLAHLIPCWSDDEGNYMALYVKEPLAGRVGYLDHEMGFNVVAAFTSLQSLYEHQFDALRRNTGHLARDYPRLRPDPPTDGADGLAFEYCIQQYRQVNDPDRRMFYAYNALSLCPVTRSSELRELMRDEDADVQGAVCQVLGKRRWAEAIPAIAEVVVAARNMSLIPAIEALGEMQSPAADEALLQAANLLHPYKLSFVIDVLKQRGYRSRKVPRSNGKYDTYRVQPPGQDQWIDVRGYETA